MAEKSDITIVETPDIQTKEVITAGVTPVHDMGGGYVEFEEKLFQRDALKELRPDLFAIKADSLLGTKSNSNFGIVFPKIAAKGDIFVRVDVAPNRIYKFDGKKWIEISKDISQTYLYDQEYIKFLISKIEVGEYDVELLTEQEKIEIEEHLKGNQNT